MIIETNTYGYRKRPYLPWEIISFAEQSEALPLHEFLSRSVSHAVNTFKQHQEVTKLIHVLSKKEKNSSAENCNFYRVGRDVEQIVDAHEAVENALLIFQVGE